MKFKNSIRTILIILLVSLVNHTYINGQACKVFIVNNQSGLVNSLTLDEYLAPQKSYISAFGSNNWKYINGDSVIIYNNTTGKIHTYLNAKNWVSITRNKLSYIAVLINNQQQLLSSDLKLFPLQGVYFQMEDMSVNGDKIIGYNASYFDIYEFKNGKLNLKHHLLASSRIMLNLQYQNVAQEYYIYYGQDHIYLVDLNGNLKHTVVSKAMGEPSILAALRPLYIKKQENVIVSMGTNEAQGYKDIDEHYVAKLKKWTVLKTTDSHYYFAKIDVPFAIVIPKEYWLSYDKSKQLFSVYKEQQNVQFSMDTVKGKIYLPKQYEDAFGISVVPFSVKVTDDTNVYHWAEVAPKPPVNWLYNFENEHKISILDGFVGNKDMSVSFIVNQDGSISNSILKSK